MTEPTASAVKTTAPTAAISNQPETQTKVKSKSKISLLEGPRLWWTKHVEANKARAAANKAKTSKDDSGQITKEKDSAADDIIETFDPAVTDMGKLTATERKAIIQAEKDFQAGVSTIKDLISPSSMEVSSYQMRLNGKYVRSFYTYDYPRFLVENWLNQIINFDAAVDISMFVYPRDSASTLKILRKKMAEMLSSKHINQKKGVVNDPAKVITLSRNKS